MKETDWRNTLEVIVKGLVAVVVGLAGVYVLGWVLSFLGGLLLGLAGIIVALLRWLVPIALIVGLVYFAVSLLQNRTKPAPKPEPMPQPKPEVNESAQVSAVSVETFDHEKVVETLEAKVTQLEQKLVDPDKSESN